MKQKQMYITEANIKQYTDYLKNEERAANTIEKYTRDILAFAEFLQGAAVTKELAIAWKNKLRETLQPASVNSMLAAVNGLFEFFKLDIKVKQFKIQKKTFLSGEKELTKEDYRKLLETAKSQGNARIYHVMQTICATGIRVSELCYITVEAVKNGQTEVTNKNKTRTVFIPDDLKKSLLRYAKQCNITDGSIFVTRTGKPLNRSNIWTAMKKLCEEAG